MNKPMYIILEGGEGCGKDTQAKLLLKYFNSKKIPCILTREPGGTPFAEEIGRRLKTENMTPEKELELFGEARKDNYEKIIQPSLQKGISVIKTRGWPSTFAYQGFGGEIDLNVIEELNKKCTKGILPSLLIILDIPPKKGLEKEVVPDRFAAKGIDYHNKVREGYLWVTKKYSDISVIIPYAEGIEKIQEKIRETIKERLNL